MTRAAGEHALPLAPERISALLLEEGALPRATAAEFEQVARAIEAVFQHEFQEVKRRLKHSWERLLPAEGPSVTEAGDVAGRESATDLMSTLRRLLHRANFQEVPVGEIAAAMRKRSIFGVRVDLDLSDFEQLAAWRRRESRRRATVTSWFGLRRRPVSISLYDRFCVFARFKGDSHFAVDRARHKKIGLAPGAVVLRLYQDVPRDDIEVLFPGVRVRMQLFDQALLGVPAAVGVWQIWMQVKAVGMIGLAILFFIGLRKEGVNWREATAALIGLGILLVFLGRQWGRFLGRKNLLHRQLAEHLHTCTLDTGVGVFLHLIDEAAEEEAAEAILAYAFLVREGAPLELAVLDAHVEKWLHEKTGHDVDFEEDDALRKLERLELVRRDADGRLVAVAPAQALARLRQRWQEQFEHDDGPR